MLTLVLSQVFAFFPEYDVVLNESTHDCGVIIVIRPNPKDIDSACEASGMLSFWVISYCCALLFLSVVIPSCLSLYENTSSLLYPLLRWIVVLTRTFSYKCSRVVIFLCIVLGSVGVVCLLAAAYYFLEKDAADPDYTLPFVSSFPNVFTLVSWLVFLIYVPYGMVSLSHFLLS